MVAVVTLEHYRLLGYVAHYDVLYVYLLRLAASAQSAFESQSCVCAAVTVFPHHHAPYATGGVAAQHKAAMGVIHRVVFHYYVLATVGWSLFLCHTALHADAVVTHIHRVVYYQSYVDVSKIYAVAVLGVPRTAHRYAIHYHVSAVVWVHMKTWRILHSHPFYQYVLAAEQPYQVISQVLILLGLLHYVRIFVLQFPGIPQFAVLCSISTHTLIHLPFHVTHLRTLHWSPLLTIAVDDAFASDGDIPLAYGIYAWQHPLLSVRMSLIQPFVWREIYKRASLHMQFYVVLQFYRSCQPHSVAYHNLAASHRRQSLGSLLKRLCVQRHSVALAATVRQSHHVLRYLWHRHLSHLRRQLHVILVILSSPRSCHQQAEP